MQSRRWCTIRGRRVRRVTYVWRRRLLNGSSQQSAVSNQLRPLRRRWIGRLNRLMGVDMLRPKIKTFTQRRTEVAQRITERRAYIYGRLYNRLIYVNVRLAGCSGATREIPRSA